MQDLCKVSSFDIEPGSLMPFFLLKGTKSSEARDHIATDGQTSNFYSITPSQDVS